MRQVPSVTMQDVVGALEQVRGQWTLARDLSIDGTIQSVSGALRHAWQHGLVKRRYVSGSVHMSEWRVP